MERKIKEKLKEIVNLMDNPENTVLEREVKEKLIEIMDLLNNPEKNKEEEGKREEKLLKVVSLVNNTMANPDVVVVYCIPEVETTSDTCNVTSDPYIHLKYISNGTHVMKQNIPLKRQYLKKEPEEIASLVTFYIERFVEQIDSVENGAQ